MPGFRESMPGVPQNADKTLDYIYIYIQSNEIHNVVALIKFLLERFVGLYIYCKNDTRTFQFQVKTLDICFLS